MERHAPLQRGKRSRDDWGIEFSRIIAFSDGVFAIAITLLVLSLDIPPSAHDLNHSIAEQYPDFLAYVLSFAVIGRLWVLHHRFFSEVTHFDGRLMSLNLLYLGLIVLIPFTTEVLGDYSGQSTAAILYAANIGLTNAAGSFLVYDAVRRGLTKPGMEWIIDNPLRWRGVVAALIFFASIPVALLSTTVAELLWILILLSGFGHRWGRPEPA
jgi:TMEM175 potassium channel family protein